MGVKNRTTSQLNGVIVLGVQEIGRTSRDGNRSQRLLSKSWLGVIFMGHGECMFGGVVWGVSFGGDGCNVCGVSGIWKVGVVNR